jgi:hypothetical protein
LFGKNSIWAEKTAEFIADFETLEKIATLQLFQRIGNQHLRFLILILKCCQKKAVYSYHHFLSTLKPKSHEAAQKNLKRLL